MQVGDLVKHRFTRELHLVVEVRKIKGKVGYVHLSDHNPQQVFYPSDLEVLSEAR
jgi:hypothetical protein